MKTEAKSVRHTVGRGTVALVVGALLVLPAVVAAQQGHHGGGDQEAPRQGMRGMMMGAQGHGGMMGMMGGMMMAGPGPGMILAQSDVLALTDAQVEEIEGLRERLSETRTEHVETMRTLHERLAEEAGAQMDLDAYESAVRSLEDERVAMHMAMARAARDAREVLTAEQREKLRVGMRMMRGMMMRMMHGREGAMQGGGGMAGGMGAMMSGMPCPMMGGSGSP